jgi:flavin reductase (DIM6/NTAB) family NADH-FMN oxidoreductase RutF
VHQVVEPKILYFGTPVMLITSRNEDGSANVAPFSSGWWLDKTCMIGMGTRSQTIQNLRREGECAINLPSVDLADAVDRLALLTARDPVPERKAAMGYRYSREKFAVAGLTPVPADLMRAPLIAECPVQMEAVIERIHQVGDENDFSAAIEARIVQVHVDEALLVPGKRDHIDPDRWRPLIMSFCEFYGLGAQVHHSRLAAAGGVPSREKARS